MEFLPNSLEKINYANISKELRKELMPYGGKVQAWKEVYEKNQQIALLQQDQTRFTEQEKEISYLEQRIQELTNLIRSQKEKIISTFLRVFPEKELVQQLITANLDFIRFKKQTEQTGYGKKKRDYEKQLNFFKDQIWDKLPEETNEEVMDKIEAILTDCEDLVKDELELEAKLKEKFRLIEEHHKTTNQITDNSEQSQKRKRIVEREENTQQVQANQFKRIRSNSLLSELEKAKLEGKVEALKELAILPRYNQGFMIAGNSNSLPQASSSQHHLELLESEYQPQIEIPPKNDL